MHFLEQAHMAGMAYDSETNSLTTSYFSIIYLKQAINYVLNQLTHTVGRLLCGLQKQNVSDVQMGESFWPESFWMLVPLS